MLKFVHHFLKDNKYKVFRWKLLHFTLPCKVLLKKWKICDISNCHYCNTTEDYDHMFLKSHFLDNFWSKVKKLLEKLNINNHILTLKNLVWGYKINDEQYYEINYLITIIMFCIYKANYMSEQKTKSLDVYSVFKAEFVYSYKMQATSKHTKNKCLLDKVVK